MRQGQMESRLKGKFKWKCVWEGIDRIRLTYVLPQGHLPSANMPIPFTLGLGNVPLPVPIDLIDISFIHIYSVENCLENGLGDFHLRENSNFRNEKI